MNFHTAQPEFDKDTKYIYIGHIYNENEEYTLEVCNDADMVEENAKNYLAAKTRNHEE